MKIDNFITRQELDKIEEAVKAAEKKTAGEIVPAVAVSSDDYPEVAFRGAVLFMLCGWLLMLVLSLSGISLNFNLFAFRWNSGESSLLMNPLLFYVVVSGGFFGLGLLLCSRVSWLRRLFISPRRINGEVRQAALETFLDQNCHLTSKHSGILIYISLFERRVEIIADKGINDALKESPEIWSSLVEKLVLNIKEGRAGEGLLEAVESCGTILAEKFPAKLINRNEIDNSVVIKE